MKTILIPILALLALLAAPADVLAQAGQVRETIPAGPFLAGAYAFIWVAVLVYVALVARRLTRVHTEIDELRRRLDRGARS
jgi:CcmD family protein